MLLYAVSYAALPLLVALAIATERVRWPNAHCGRYTVIGPWTAAVAWEQAEQDPGSDAYASLVATTTLSGCSIALLARWLSWRYVPAMTLGALAGAFLTLLWLIVRAGGREPMSMLTSWCIGAAVAPGMILVASGAAL